MSQNDSSKAQRLTNSKAESGSHPPTTTTCFQSVPIVSNSPFPSLAHVSHDYVAPYYYYPNSSSYSPYQQATPFYSQMYAYPIYGYPPPLSQVLDYIPPLNAPLHSYTNPKKPITHQEQVEFQQKKRTRQTPDLPIAKKPHIVPTSETLALQHANRLKTVEESVACDEEGHLILDFTKDWTPRYKLVKLLGQGTFGKVALAFDSKKHQHCAIKIIKAIQKYREASRTEIKILLYIQEHDPHQQFHCIGIQDYFNYRNHICMVFELLSESIFDFLKGNDFQPFPMTHIRSFAFQILQAVAFLHKLKLIHTDLKPENIMLVENSYSVSDEKFKILKNTRIKLIDFGSAIFEKDHHSSVVSTRHYRAPEVILGIPWSYPCDIWSIGCILVEFYTGKALFQTHENLEHLAMMEIVIGKMPNHLYPLISQKAHAFFSNGKLNFPNESTDKKSKRFLRKMKSLRAVLNPKDLRMEQFFDLIHRMLRFDPMERITADESLLHPFFTELVSLPIG